MNILKIALLASAFALSSAAYASTPEGTGHVDIATAAPEGTGHVDIATAAPEGTGHIDIA